MARITINIDDETLKAVQRMAVRYKASTAEQVRVLIEWGLESGANAEKVPVEKARQLYDELGNWREVADNLKRRNGSKFQETSIRKAVRREDRGGMV